jgi:hypothetical protein
MKANELEEYSAKELDRLARERDEAIKAKGGLPYLGSLQVGETKLWLQPKIPTDNPDQEGRPRNGSRISEAGSREAALRFARPEVESRIQFVVKKENSTEEYAWTVNIKSPLYRDLLGFLVKSPIWLRVIRTGEGRQDTRYTVKAA